MRDVGEQVLLGADEALDALGHLVEGARELADLVATPRVGAVGRRARGQVSAAQAPRRRRQALERPRDALRERPRRDGHHEEGEADDDHRAPERRRAHGTRHRALHEGDHGARRRIADGCGGEAHRTRAHDHASGADGGLLGRRERRQLVAGGGDHAPLEVAHAHGKVEVVVDLSQPRAERGRIRNALAHERGQVARHARGHLAPEGVAGAQREHHGRRHRDHEEHTEEVEVDPRVQARHVSRRPAAARNRHRAPS